MNDESARGKTRLVIKLKRTAPGLVILNNLYKHTPLQTNFAVNTVALVDGIPRTLNLVQALQAYVDHQVEVIRRRSEFRLEEGPGPRPHRRRPAQGRRRHRRRHRPHPGLGRPDRRAGGAHVGALRVLRRQAEHILELRLGQLTRLAKVDLETELAGLRETIAILEGILGDETVLRTVIKNELAEVKEKFADARRSKITFDVGDMNIEDLIDDEELVVTLSAKGYIKTVSSDSFRSQGRGGRGVAGAKLRDEDYVSHILTTTAHAYLLFFSNLGRADRLKAHEIPKKERTGTRHGDAEPAAAAAGRAHPDDHRHARLRDEPVPVLRHQERPGEEDQVQRVRLVAAHRHHRHQPPRRRRAGEGHPHQRWRRHPDALQAGAGHPLQRRRRALDGPSRGRPCGA